MRRRTTLSLAFTLVLVALLSYAPGMLAKQDEQEPISDPAPSFEDIIVSCNGEACESIEGQQTYTVDFLAHSYIPEQTYAQAIVVLVQAGTLAFRVQTGDVIVDPQGNAGVEASDLITMLSTTSPVLFGETPSAVPDAQQPQYAPDPAKEADCSRAPNGPLENLCLLNPDQFRDEVTFVQLEEGDIVYLPAGSSCFVCNVTDSGNGDARALVWAPGSGFTWYESSRQDNSLGTPAAQGSDRILGWMLNPGSRCN